ncbi:hypothetical protein BpHYR1_015417 [Brachionus plicatilis]|uniref:Uncharacterized protein n=1 Tax=Brachionus plicatilis TaxID=10195 RepID=A0A3M7R206_BRAPC|nr:hypothetical protein BpHYR1_015417 [Brachionus plicatilis]
MMTNLLFLLMEYISANKNDASILDYILEKDEDLLRILEPEKTFLILNRGFRDTHKKLGEVYNFYFEATRMNKKI